MEHFAFPVIYSDAFSHFQFFCHTFTFLRSTFLFTILHFLTRAMQCSMIGACFTLKKSVLNITIIAIHPSSLHGIKALALYHQPHLCVWYCAWNGPPPCLCLVRWCLVPTVLSRKIVSETPSVVSRSMVPIVAYQHMHPYCICGRYIIWEADSLTEDQV